MKSYIVDFSNFEIADDEVNAVLHYGGEIKISGPNETHVFYPVGTDRDGGPWDDLRNCLTTKFAINFDKIEADLEEKAHACEADVTDTDEYFNLYYLENVGEKVEIVTDESGSVLSIKEYLTMSDRLAKLIEKNLAEMLNGPGTHMAFDDETEFEYKWNDGQTSVTIGDDDSQVQYKFRLQVVETK